MVDVRAFHSGSNSDVGEAQRQQVLDRLLAEIMVDAEDAVLGKGAATASLISRLESRSVPSGFSSAMRTVGQASPAAASPSIVGSNRDGAVDRKIARPWQGRRSLSAAARSRRIVDVERLVMKAREEALGDPLLEEARREVLLQGLGALGRGSSYRPARVRAVPTIFS